MDAALNRYRLGGMLRGCLAGASVLAAASCTNPVANHAAARESSPTLAPLTVETTTSVTREGNHVRPFIVARPGGGAYLAWARRDEERTRVLFATSRDGIRYGAPIEVSPDEMDLDLGAESGPQVAVGPDGAVHVVWAAGSWKASRPSEKQRRAPARPGNLNIYLASSRDDGDTFSAPVKVNDDNEGAEHRFPTVAVDARGGVCVTWLDKRLQSGERPDFSRVFFARSTNGGRGFAANIDATAGQDHGICHCCKMGMAVHSKRGVHIAFRNAVGELRDIFLVRAVDNDLRFTKPEPIDDADWQFPGCPMNGPSLAFDHRDRLHAVWLTGGNVPGTPAVGPDTDEGHKVLYRVLDTRKNTWGDPLFLAIGSHPRLAVDAAGTARVAWEYDGLRLATISGTDARAIQSVTVSKPGVIANFPSVATTSRGLLFIAWQQQQEGGHTQVCVATIAGEKRTRGTRR